MKTQKLLTEVQFRISRAMTDRDGPDNSYSSIYMYQEISYWSPVPAWIDSLNNVKSVLDVGTAYGTLLIYSIARFDPMVRTAIDPIAYMPEDLVKQELIERITGDFEREDLVKGRKFDLIIFTEVLEHLNFHPLKTLERLISSLNSGGTLILTTPDGGTDAWGRVQKYYSKLLDMPAFIGQTDPWIDDHIWQFTTDEVADLIEKLGVTISAFSYSPGVWARHQCWMLTKI